MLTHIGEASVSANIVNNPGAQLVVACRLTQAARRFGAVSVIIAQTDGEGGLHEVCTLSGEEFRGIGEGDQQPCPTSNLRSYKLEWHPVNLLPTKSQYKTMQRIEISQIIESSFARTLAFDLASHLPVECQGTVVQYRPELMNVNSLQIVLDDRSTTSLTDCAETWTPQEIAKQLARFKSVLLVNIAPTNVEHSITPSINTLARREGQTLVTLEYQDIPHDEHKFIHLLEEVIERSFATDSDQELTGVDYRYRDGMLSTLKLVPHEPTVAQIRSVDSNDPVRGIATYHQPRRAIKLDFKTPGLLTSACFVEHEESIDITNSADVLVKIYAHAINQTDVSMALGRAQHSESIVGEFSGVVVGLGSGAEAEFSIGDRVCGWGSSPYTNTAKVKCSLLHHIADDISFAEGATIPFAFQTAYHALIDIARLERSHTILIHGAAGGVGQAAISLARHVGADIYVTVGDDSKRQFMVDAVQIPSDHIFSNRSTEFGKKVHEMTGGSGVDVVLNCCSTDLIDTSLSCVSEFGFVINLLKSTTNLSASCLRKNISIVSVDMNALKNRHPSKLQTKFQKVMALYNEKHLRPLTRTCLPMEELISGFKLVQSQSIVGKVVLTADDSTLVKQVLEKPCLDPDATFVVHGGKSHTRQDIFQYLEARGAAHILCVSPTGVVEQYSFGETEDVRPQKLQLKHSETQCPDIESTILNTFGNMPPVKGIFDLREAAEVREGPFCFDNQLILLQTPSPVDRFANNYDKHSGQPGATTTRLLGNVLRDQTLDFFIALTPMEALIEGECPDDGSLEAQLGKNIQHRMRLLTLGQPIPQSPLPETGLAGQDDAARTDAAHMSALWDYCLGSVANKEAALDLLLLDQGNLGASASEDRLRQKFPFWRDLKEVDTPNKDQPEHDTKRIDHKLKQARNQDQAQEIILDEVRQQLAAFCALEVEDIAAEAAIADIGLDSLLAIEFKNWIVRTLHAPMQTTEILDAPTLNDLVVLIAQRSAFASSSSKLEKTTTTGHEQDIQKVLPVLNGSDANHSKLPPLQIPPLKNLIERHLTYIKAFASEEEFQNTKRIAERFQQPDGPGSELYNRLLAVKAANPENWYHDLYLKSQYLVRNGALAPYMLFFFSHPLSPVEHSQSARASLIVSTLIRYKNNLEAGKVKPRYMHEQQLCMDLYKNLFNTCRTPQIGLDRFQQHPGNNYFVVLRRGQAYKIDFGGSNLVPSHDSLEATFAAILQQDLAQVDWTGILTADNRVSWAKNYRMFVESSPQNAKYIETMERASFIICLDDAEPETPEQRARQIHFGDGSNRWFDKSMQFVVCSNGISGVVADHTGLDAPTVQELNLLIADAISDYNPIMTGTRGKKLEVEELAHTGCADIEGEFQRIKANFENAIGSQHHFFPKPLSWGSSLVKSYKLPPNSIFQLVVQIAAFHYFGYIPATWETVLQSTFHKGRVEINQIVSEQVATFVRAAVDTEAPTTACRQLLSEAARTHSGTVLACTRAGGSDRFLTILRDMVEAGEEEPELYKDPVYKRSRPRKLISNCFKTHMAENGCFMKDGNAIWLHFEVEEDRYVALSSLLLHY